MASSNATAVLNSVGHDLIQSFVPVIVETFIIGLLTLPPLSDEVAANVCAYYLHDSGVLSACVHDRSTTFVSCLVSLPSSFPPVS